MAFAPRYSGCFFGVAAIACASVITGCGVLSDHSGTPGKRLSNVFVQRATPSRWYDELHREYYDVHGPVSKLTLQPIDLHAGETSGDASGWELYFDEQGRIKRKVRTLVSPEFEVRYVYRENGTIQRIESRKDQRLYRTTVWHYDMDGKLAKQQFIDHESGEQFHVNIAHQEAAQGGSYVIYRPVENVDMVEYRQYGKQQRLLWSNRGVRVNGAGKAFYIQTRDDVTSGEARRVNTQQMTGVGGYRYQYDEHGRLKKVVSFNSNGNDVYHYTRYSYNQQGLLMQEKKSVVGESLFNTAKEERARYEYIVTDTHGNWTHRSVTVSSDEGSFSYQERRTIQYHEPL
jgi:hypothetical protein